MTDLCLVLEGEKYQLKARHIAITSSGISSSHCLDENSSYPSDSCRSLFERKRECVGEWCRILKRLKRKTIAAYLNKI